MYFSSSSKSAQESVSGRVGLGDLRRLRELGELAERVYAELARYLEREPRAALGVGAGVVRAQRHGVAFAERFEAVFVVFAVDSGAQRELESADVARGLVVVFEAEGAQRRFERLRVVAEAVRRERAALYVGQYLAPDLGEGWARRPHPRRLCRVSRRASAGRSRCASAASQGIRRILPTRPRSTTAEPYLAYRALAVVGAFEVYRREGEFVAFRQVVGGLDNHARASEPGRLSARVWARHGFFAGEHIARQSREDYLPAGVSAARAELNDVVRLFHHVYAVFDEEQRVARVGQLVEELHERLYVVEVQAVGRLVEDDIEPALVQVRGELDALELAAR